MFSELQIDERAACHTCYMNHEKYLNIFVVFSKTHK